MRVVERRLIPAPMEAVFAALVEEEEERAPGAEPDPGDQLDTASTDGRTWLVGTMRGQDGFGGGSVRFDLRPADGGTDLALTMELRPGCRYGLLFWLAARFGMKVEEALGGFLAEEGPAIERAALEIASGQRPPRPPSAEYAAALRRLDR